MGRKIRIKRGLKSKLPKLDVAELGYTTDTEEVFVGSNIKNIQLSKKDELDEFKVSTMAQLADTTNKNPIYLTDYNVHHLNSAVDNTTFIQQAVIEAEKTGRPIILPWVPDGYFININDSIKIEKGHIKITGYGRESRFKQATFPKPIFSVLAPNVEIRDFAGYGATFNASGFTIPYRGDLQQSYHAAVSVNADNVTVKNIYADNMVTGVIFVAWDVKNDMLRASLRNCLIDNLEVNNVNFGLLVTGVENFNYSKIRGNYKLMPGVPTAPHLIYFSNGVGVKNINTVGSDLVAYDGLLSYAYQFKGMSGGSLYNVSAKNCMGSVHIMDSENFKVDGVTSVGDTWNSNVYGSLSIEGVNSKIDISNVNIRLSGSGKGVQYTNDVSDSTLKNAFIETNHTTENTTGFEFDVDVKGTNNTFDDITVRNIGAFQRYASIGIWEGSNITLSKIKTSGNNKGLVVRAGTGHIVKDYSLGDLKFVDNGTPSSRAMEIVLPTDLRPITSTMAGIGDQSKLLAYDRGDAIAGSAGAIAFTTSGHQYILKGGTWNVKNGVIYSSGDTPYATVCIDVGMKNIELSCGMKLVAYEGLALRMVDRSNGLRVQFNKTTNILELDKLVAGVKTSLITAAFTGQVGRRYKISTKIYNDLIDVYIDGAKILTHTLSTSDYVLYGTQTVHGIIGHGKVDGKFDNIEWRSLE